MVSQKCALDTTKGRARGPSPNHAPQLPLHAHWTNHLKAWDLCLGGINPSNVCVHSPRLQARWPTT